MHIQLLGHKSLPAANGLNPAKSKNNFIFLTSRDFYHYRQEDFFLFSKIKIGKLFGGKGTGQYRIGGCRGLRRWCQVNDPRIEHQKCVFCFNLDCEMISNTK